MVWAVRLRTLQVAFAEPTEFTCLPRDFHCAVAIVRLESLRALPYKEGSSVETEKLRQGGNAGRREEAMTHAWVKGGWLLAATLIASAFVSAAALAQNAPSEREIKAETPYSEK